MLPQSNFIACNDELSKHFLKALRNTIQLSRYQLYMSTSRKELDKVHVLQARKFCRPTVLRKSMSQSKVATRLQLNVCWYTSVACKYEKRNHSGGHNEFLLNCNSGCKKHTARLALESIAIFTSAFAGKV